MIAEEFNIYMHYVRKLGFEETPDYDFLRELFTKVLRSLGEEEDGVYDWMLLNNGKGWETLPVSTQVLHEDSAWTKLKWPRFLQPVPKEQPHVPREHRTRDRDRDHGHRRSRQPLESGPPASPLVLAPSPAHVRQSRRTTANDASRGGSREHVSVQPLAPASRRASQHRVERDRSERVDRDREREQRESAHVSAPHPYANANTQPGYRTTAYGRSSPVQQQQQQANGSDYANGNGSSPVMPPTSNYQYGAQPSASRQSGFDTHTPTNGSRPQANGNKGMYMYENQQMPRGVDQDEHGDGKKKGFFAALCCRT